MRIVIANPESSFYIAVDINKNGWRNSLTLILEVESGK